MPKRIQRSRRKGYRLPPGAVCVDRTTRWGNPYKVPRGADRSILEQSIALYRDWVVTMVELGRRDFRELRGKDLACWCPLGQPCHADVLLKLANAEPAP